MRRLFHGRMITVDGHMRRMSENYELYAINANNDIAQSLRNINVETPVYGEKPQWTVVTTDILSGVEIPVQPSKTYTVKTTQAGYDIYITPLDEEGRFYTAGKSWTQNVSTFTGDVHCSYLLLAVKSHTSGARVRPGDCGLLITEE